MNPQTVLLVDDNDKFLGYSSVDEAHTGSGKQHRAFVTLLFDKNNRVLLQRRKHKLFDGFWDFTAISHNLRVNGRDENYQEASDRAIKKEMGIGHVQVNKVGAFNYFARDGQNCENEYCAVLTGNFSGSFKPNKDEVYEAEWVKFDEFISDTYQNPKKYTPWAKKAAKIIASSQSSKTNRFAADDFKKELNQFLKIFQPYTKSYFEKKIKLVSKYPGLITKIYKELEDFSSGGKAIRPFLVYLGYRISSRSSRPFGKTQGEQARTIKNILPICLAFELVHSFLLIHDDIIDRSELRRGKPTVHKKFEETIHPSPKATDGKHYGVSQAIVAGDIACLEAFKLINQSDFNNQMKSVCITMLVDVILETGYGEMLDVDLVHKRSTLDNIWQVAELKTARYSFVGPLTIGAILAQRKKSQLAVLEKYGLALGLAFQLRDDLLGVFGNEKILGKSTLSDMREGKNTVLYYKAQELAQGKDKRDLIRLWGDEKASQSDLARVCEIIETSGAKNWSQDEMSKFIISAKKSIKRIANEAEIQNILIQLADFVIWREN